MLSNHLILCHPFLLLKGGKNPKMSMHLEDILSKASFSSPCSSRPFLLAQENHSSQDHDILSHHFMENRWGND